MEKWLSAMSRWAHGSSFVKKPGRVQAGGLFRGLRAASLGTTSLRYCSTFLGYSIITSPHLLEIGVRKGSLCICHPGSRLICRSHRDEACAAGWQGVDRMWTCGNNKAPTFLWRLCFVWCGTRRTVCFGETRFFGRLEFAGKIGVPQLVTINKSASYGIRWNRTRDFLEISTLSVCK